MKIYEYLINVLGFMLVSIKDASLTTELINQLLESGYETTSKVLEGVFNDKKVVIIPASDVAGRTGTVAYADLINLDNVTVDLKMLDSEYSELRIQLLAHEVEHLKRGLISVAPNTIRSLNDLGRLYLEEEQIINAKVAPLMFSRYEEMVTSITVSNWIDDPVGKQLVQAGVLALYNVSQEHKDVIDVLIQGTYLEGYIKKIWG